MASFRARPETVLVVEDEGLVRMDAAESLRDAGFAVLEATDAAEAMEIVLSGEEIDVLFTDINMPGAMDGLELARRVHDCRPHVRLLLTSGAIKPTRDQIPDDGAFISKPYSPEAVTRPCHPRPMRETKHSLTVKWRDGTVTRMVTFSTRRSPTRQSCQSRGAGG